MLWLTVRNLLVIHTVWRYRRGVAWTDVVITGLGCICRSSCTSLHYHRKAPRMLRWLIGFWRICAPLFSEVKISYLAWIYGNFGWKCGIRGRRVWYVSCRNTHVAPYVASLPFIVVAQSLSVYWASKLLSFAHVHMVCFKRMFVTHLVMCHDLNTI